MDTSLVMKLILITAITTILLSALTAAHSGEDFTEAETLIGSKVSCGSLNDTQLEMMGDYYMEQMHPGALHEAMDGQMGGEGSESLKQMHIRMARTFYCGNESEVGAGMMKGMMGGDSHMTGRSGVAGVIGCGMMNYGTSNSFNLNGTLLTVLLLLLIALTTIIIMRLLKGNGTTRGKEIATRHRNKKTTGGDSHGMLWR